MLHALDHVDSARRGNMDYQMISVDDHIDLGYLPKDLWSERLPKSLRERGPRVMETESGASVWVCDGQNWGRWAGGRWVDEARSYQTALERAGVEKEGVLRPTTAHLRLNDMDRDGVEATVMFGPVHALAIADPELRLAAYRAYNDWLSEFCAYDAKRLFGVAVLPAEDPAGATAEVYRLAQRGGIRQASMHIARVTSPVYSAAWEPFWTAVEETGLIASFHLVLSNVMLQGLNEEPAAVFETTKGFITQFLDPFVGLLGRGVLERHPGAKLVLAESGLGWLPWVIQEMDYRYRRLVSNKEYWNQRGGIGLSMPPSEVFRRQVYVTFQDDEVGVDLLKYFGEDKVMWASDYPHPDSTWPHSRQAIQRQMSNLSPQVQKKILRENALKLYGLRR
jgi:predicted TIM-barrel fold metal-dependent hydrolase